MRLPDDATLYIRIWTGQTCSACGSKFQYLRRYTVPRSNTDQQATQVSVEADYVKAATETSEIVVPCPQCGYIQPDMVATRKAVRHGVFTFAIFLLLLVNTFTAGFGLVPSEVAAIIAASLAAVALPFHIYQMLADLNRDTLANLGQAQKLVQKGMLRLIKTGEIAQPNLIVKPWLSYLEAIGMLVVAIAMFVAPSVADMPFWLLEVAGIILFIASGSRFANAALKIKAYANPREVVEAKTTLVEDDSVPEDFQK